MPDALELPGMLGAVIPLMCGERFAGLGRRVVDELVALALGHSSRRGLLARRRAGLRPGLAAVIGPLNDLPEPAAGLGSEQTVRIARRTLEVVNLPARKMRAVDVPLLAPSIRSKDKRALAGANQHSYLAHVQLLCRTG